MMASPLPRNDFDSETVSGLPSVSESHIPGDNDAGQTKSLLGTPGTVIAKIEQILEDIVDDLAHSRYMTIELRSRRSGRPSVVTFPATTPSGAKRFGVYQFLRAAGRCVGPGSPTDWRALYRLPNQNSPCHARCTRVAIGRHEEVSHVRTVFGRQVLNLDIW